MKKKIKKNIFIFIFFIIIFYVFDTFTNTYIVLKDDHHTRLTRQTGFCEKTGYGFHKIVLEKFTDINENIYSLNFNGYPSSEGYFYDYNKKYSDNYLLLIGANGLDLDSYLEKDYKLIYSKENCHLISK